MRVCARCVEILLLVFCLISAAHAADDTQVRARIQTFAPLAERLVVDGHGKDWRALPAIRDSLRESNDPTRDGLNDKNIDDANIKTSSETASGNFVVLEVGDDLRLDFLHLREGSITVRAGQDVKTGETLGAVGNSGRSIAPHLHLAARRSGASNETLPIRFSKVRVRLNGMENDVWTREVKNWSPREGVLIENWF